MHCPTYPRSMKKRRRQFAATRKGEEKLEYLQHETGAARDVDFFFEDGHIDPAVTEGFAMHLLKMVSEKKGNYFRDLADALDAYEEMSFEGSKIIVPSNAPDPAALILAKAYEGVAQKDYATVIEEARRMDHQKALPASDATLRNILREIGCDMVDARKK